MDPNIPGPSNERGYDSIMDELCTGPVTVLEQVIAYFLIPQN